MDAMGPGSMAILGNLILMFGWATAKLCQGSNFHVHKKRGSCDEFVKVDPYIRPYFLGGVALRGSPLDSRIKNIEAYILIGFVLDLGDFLAVDHGINHH